MYFATMSLRLRSSYPSEKQCCIADSSTTSTKPVRFITAFPNGNTGAMVYFLPVGDGTLGAQLDLGSLASVSQDNNQTGITGNFTLTGDADFGVSIRAYSCYRPLMTSW